MPPDYEGERKRDLGSRIEGLDFCFLLTWERTIGSQGTFSNSLEWDIKRREKLENCIIFERYLTWCMYCGIEHRSCMIVKFCLFGVFGVLGLASGSEVVQCDQLMI